MSKAQVLKSDEMKYQVIALDAEGKNGRLIFEATGVPQSTSHDFLNKNTHKVWWAESYDKGNDVVSEVAEEAKAIWADVGEIVAEKVVGSKLVTQGVYSIVTTKEAKVGGTHLMITDPQCKPDIDMSYMEVIGQYIVDKQPDVIINIGDHADMPSLSIYDKGKRTAEGKRVKEDIASAIDGMNKLLKPLYDLQQSQLAEFGEVLYKPKMVLTLGNHEHRIIRHVDANPELHGFLSYADLKYEESGWEVYDFLKPALINGVAYVHYMANPMTGKPYGGNALNILKQVGESFCMGHKQCLDVATRFLPASGKQQWAIIAGACYPHDEAYKGYQGNHHWRGVVVQHRVKDGSFEPMFVSTEYLLERYKGETK